MKITLACESSHLLLLGLTTLAEYSYKLWESYRARNFQIYITEMIRELIFRKHYNRPTRVTKPNLINRGHNFAALTAAELCPHFFTMDGLAVQFIPIKFSVGLVMRPNTSPLEHLTAFAIVFAAGILSTASFIVYIERVRRNAVRDHYKRLNSESNLAAPSSTRERIDE